MLEAHYTNALLEKGVEIWTARHGLRFLKPLSVAGNSLVSRRGYAKPVDTDGPLHFEQYETDNLFLDLERCAEGYRLWTWNWIPGPGPADFSVVLPSQQEVVDFVLSFYFGENEYFLARWRYEEQHPLR